MYTVSAFVGRQAIDSTVAYLPTRQTHHLVTCCSETTQGSPLSPILYLFYNADLVEQCNEQADTMSTGYIDDVAILAWGKTTERTCQILSMILEKAQ
jgi:hypothetical protein